MEFCRKLCNGSNWPTKKHLVAFLSVRGFFDHRCSLRYSRLQVDNAHPIVHIFVLLGTVIFELSPPYLSLRGKFLLITTEIVDSTTMNTPSFKIQDTSKLSLYQHSQTDTPVLFWRCTVGLARFLPFGQLVMLPETTAEGGYPTVFSNDMGLVT